MYDSPLIRTDTKILLEALLSLKLGTYHEIQWTSGEENSPTLSQTDPDEKENSRSDQHDGQGSVVLDEIEGYSDDEKEPPKKRQRRSNDGTSSKSSRPRKSSAGSKRKAAGKRRR